VSQAGRVMGEGETLGLARRMLRESRAEWTTVEVSASRAGNVRFACGAVTTSEHGEGVRVRVEAGFGTRSAGVTVGGNDEATLRGAVRRAEELARRAPEDPEFVAPLGPQRYEAGRAYADSTAAFSPVDLAALVEPALAAARAAGVSAAGFAEARVKTRALVTSAGLEASERMTAAGLSLTARSADGNGSGWASANGHDLATFDARAVARRAIDKCLASRRPARLAPGHYTTLLEAPAVASLVEWLRWAWDARAADEGRSVLSRPGGNALGEALFPETISLRSDPCDALAPGPVFDDEGQPLRPTVWVDRGVVRNLGYSRYWARKCAREPVPFGSNLVLPGTGVARADLLRGIERGLLVTHFWYIRMVDPQSLLLTGLTRDGTFLIERGEVVGPVNNFRFNQSPVEMLKNVVALGATESADEDMAVPALVADRFHFSSVSESS
jgi:predicted Zn-dependent protease